MVDVLNEDVRKAILDDLYSEGNIKRKQKSFRRLDIYDENQDDYIIEALNKQFTPENVQEMRVVKSINIAPAVVNELSPLYNDKPVRTFLDKAARPLSTEQDSYAHTMYELARADEKLLQSNRAKKYQHQVFLQTVPAKGIIDVRVLHPHQLDVVVSDVDPESGEVYITSTYSPGGPAANSREGRTKARHVWWTDTYNFITDGNGVLTSDPEDMINPIGRLPFIDISGYKNNTFWVKKGSAIIDFAIELAVSLSDTATINLLQGFAQMVWKTKEKPLDTRVGPMNAHWLKIDPDATTQDDVVFITPEPNLDASLSWLDKQINIFLTSRGIDPKTISTTGEGKKYSSGWDRMLAMIKQLESSKDDIELYRGVEAELYSQMVAWSNVYVGATNSPLKVKPITLPEDSYVSVKYAEPQLVQTKTEIIDTESKLLDKGLRSRVQALMAIDDIDEATAIARLQDAAKHEALINPQGVGANDQTSQGRLPEASEETAS